MGTTYYVVNTEKRQYLQPLRSAKLAGLLWGYDGNALAHLLAGAVSPDHHLDSWAGDPILLVGDGSDPCDIHQLRPKNADSARNAWEIVTEEYDDITLNVLASMCRRRELIAKEFFEEAESSDSMFVMLSHIAMYLGDGSFAGAFENHFGKDWRSRYKRAAEVSPWNDLMPMTDVNRKNPDILGAGFDAAELPDV